MTPIRLFILCIFIALMFLLTGCSTVVPVKVTFPELPADLAVQCTPLKKIPDDAKLSDITKTITDNYTIYHACAANNNGLLEWYTSQKKIFESLK